jgi:hypothetical protein
MRSFRSVEAVRVALAAALGLSSSCGARTPLSSSNAGGTAPPDSSANSADASPQIDATTDSSVNPADASPRIDATTDLSASPADASPRLDATPCMEREAGLTVDAPPGPGARFPCTNPTPFLVGGKDTGYDTCQGGTLRRRAIVDCPNLLPRASGGVCSGADSPCSACKSDSDCTMHPFGMCEPTFAWCSCSYGCVRECDCPSGDICVCADPVGRCEPASCNAGTCPAGFDCAEYPVNVGCGGNAFACQTANDTCLTNSDCPGRGGAFCIFEVPDASPPFGNPPTSGRRTCYNGNCSVDGICLLGRD